jgi:hypothetical protein
MMSVSSPGAYGPLHEYMVAAFAEALGLTPEELQARYDDGDTPWDIAQEQGLTQEEFAELVVTARTEALNQAVAEGAITRQQADWMIQRMDQMHENGFTPGSCPGMTNGRGQGRRWNNSQNTQPTN